MLVDFIFTLLNLTQNSLPETDFQIQAVPRIEVEICLLYGSPCTQHFVKHRLSVLNLACLVEFAAL